MADTQAQPAGADFTSNLGKIYTIYTGGFFAFIVLIIVLVFRPSGLLGERVADRA